MFCKYCGCQNADEVKFCKECGKRIALDSLTESSSTTNNISKEEPSIISERIVEKPSMHDRDIIYCDSIKNMDNHRKIASLRWIIFSLLGIMIAAIFGVYFIQFIYSCMNPMDQIYLKYTLRITPIKVIIIPLGLLGLFYFRVYTQMNKIFSDLTHEQLHVTNKGIWGTSAISGQFAYRFDEIKSVIKSNKVPSEIRKTNAHLPMDGHFLEIALYDSQVIQYTLIGKNQIELVYTTLQPLIGKPKK